MMFALEELVDYSKDPHAIHSVFRSPVDRRGGCFPQGFGISIANALSGAISCKGQMETREDGITVCSMLIGAVVYRASVEVLPEC